MRRLLLCMVFPLALMAGPGGDITRALRENAFDRNECYRVRDISISVEDIRLFLSDGHLIFSKPVAGKPVSAVFVADTDGGDGEVIVMPPNAAERKSLSKYIETPNLDEHIQAVLLLFTGDFYDRLKLQVDQSASTRKMPELAPLYDEKWTPVLRNISASYETRLAIDLIGPMKRQGLFTALVSSSRLGNFDILFDPSSTEQILIGQVKERQTRYYFDVWTVFQSRSFRNKPAPPLDFTTSDYRIDATVNPDLSMSVITRVKVTPEQDGVTAVPFEISPLMQVTETTVDGKPAETLQRAALRANIMRNGNELFLILPPEPLKAGTAYEFEFRHTGRIITAADDQIYYVSSRAEWYPTQGLQFSNFDLLFRYPRELTLVTAGQVVEDKTEGEQRVTLRRTQAPVCMVGFNLGKYAHEQVVRGAFSVDVYANQTLEAALRPPPQVVANPLQDVDPRKGGQMRGLPMYVPAPAPKPADKLRELAAEIASAMEFMSSKFGPPVLPSLTVSPIPGNFGQGFPGLIYLSTSAYLNTVATLKPNFEAQRQMYLEELLQEHETAHQWWGNLLLSREYSDYWLTEALANYSALLYLEKRRGTKARDVILDVYRAALMENSSDQSTVESAGPVVLGSRLESSLEPRAYRSIIYGKGTWILHMLRVQMGDDRFYAMLAELARQYNRKQIGAEEFRTMAARFLPPKSDDPTLETFFSNWVFGTGIPELKLSYSLKGKPGAYKLTGTVKQGGVDSDFTTLAPVEIQLARGKPLTYWVRTGSDPTTFTISLKEKPLKVTLDPNHAVLRK